MKLKPFEDNPINEEETPSSNFAVSVLEEVGLIESEKDRKKDDKTRIKEYFTKHGAGLEDVAKATSVMLRSGEESTRLKAAEISLKVHEVFKEMDNNVIPQITINIKNEFTQNNNLISLVMPSN